MNVLTAENLKLKASAAELRSKFNKAEMEPLKVLKKVENLEKQLESSVHKCASF